MKLSEFNLIDHYFKQVTTHPSIVCGIGDDAAIVQPPPQHDLILTIDTMVAGVHFPIETPPHAIGHKILAVNLSDLAAMAAIPQWITLALTLPTFDDDWLTRFSQGLFTLAKQHQVSLIGGDTTSGPLSITIQAHGITPHGQAIRRSSAKPGDIIYVTGTLGDAGLALLALQHKADLSDQAMAAVLECLNYPEPRVQEGIMLRQYVNSMVDISDGLVADLGHILQKSQVGATLHLEQLPLSQVMQQWLAQTQRWELPLTAGDDFELCFTAPNTYQAQIAQLPFKTTAIGVIEQQAGLRCLQHDVEMTLEKTGYQHF